MYISITPQKLAANYSASASEFVAYLEKENQGLEEPDMERGLPEGSKFTQEDLHENFEQIYRDVQLIFGG